MEQASRAILLLLAAIMAVQLFQGGPEQLKQWAENKFLGNAKTIPKPQAAPATPATPAQLKAATGPARAVNHAATTIKKAITF